MPRIPAEIDRDTDGIACKCGGYADRDYSMTKKEVNDFGCGRDTQTSQCCARAFMCRVCKTRYVGAAPAPEME